MSAIGWIGLGKLGLPCALALDAAGHEVVGYDVSPNSARWLADRTYPHVEEGIEAMLATHEITMADSIPNLVATGCEVVYVAVQTPHAPGHDGSTPMADEARDFEYGYLVEAVRTVCRAAEDQQSHTTVVIVSTVLPGTFNTHLRMLGNPYATFVYNPFFIAMGTTVADFTNPEFVLIGVDDDLHVGRLHEVYAKVHCRPLRIVSIESAELTKVAYNVYVSNKIAIANHIGEICAKTGADADEVAGSLALATDRICSSRYMRAGMGDSGACHGRDLLALRSLSQRLGLSTDLGGYLMAAREAHSAWLAGTVAHWAALTRLPVEILGRAYKPEVALVDGSCSDLLVEQLRTQYNVAITSVWDPIVGCGAPPSSQAVFFVATDHAEFRTTKIPAGSVVIDPFGSQPDRPWVTTVRLGRTHAPG